VPDVTTGMAHAMLVMVAVFAISGMTLGSPPA
jgi:hypothetical protein